MADLYEEYKKKREEGKLEVPSPNLNISEMSDVLKASLGVKGEQASAKGVELVQSGYPDNGKIYKLPDGTYNYVSDSYSTTNQDEIAKIASQGTAGTLDVDPATSFKSRAILEQDPQNIAGAAGAKYLYSLPFVGSRALGALENVTGSAGLEERGMRAKQALEQERPGVSATVSGTSIGSSGGLGFLLSNSIKYPQSLTNLASKTIRSESPVARALSNAAATGTLAATEGYIYGSGEEGASPFLRAGAQGGIGAVLGALSTPFGALINRFVNKESQTSIAPNIASQFGISMETARLIESQIARGMDFNEAIQNIKRAGSEGMIADADQATQALLDAAMASGAQGTRSGEKAISERLGKSTQKVESEIERIFGPRTDPSIDPVEAIRARTAPQRNIAYNKAYATPIDYTTKQGQRILNVFNEISNSPIGRKIIKESIDAANLETTVARLEGGSTPFKKQLEINLDEYGNLISFKEQPNVFQLDQIKRQLDKIGQDVDANGVFTREAQLAQKMSKVLREAVGASVPKYRKALAIGGDAIQEDIAYKFGNDIFNPKKDLSKLANILDGASLDTKAALKLGIRNKIAQIFDEAMVTAGKASASDVEATRSLIKTLSSRSSKEKMIKVLGDSETNKLLKEIDAAKSSFELRARTGGQSLTARRQSTQEAAKEIVELGSIRSILEGKPKNAASNIQKLIESTTEKERLDQLYSEAIDLLTKRKGRSAESAIRYIRRAMEGVKPTNTQARFIAEEVVKGAKTYAGYPFVREWIPAETMP